VRDEVHTEYLWENEGKTQLGRFQRRWENNIKMNLPEVGCGTWAGLIWLLNRNRWQALVNAVMNLRVP